MQASGTAARLRLEAPLDACAACSGPGRIGPMASLARSDAQYEQCHGRSGV